MNIQTRLVYKRVLELVNFVNECDNDEFEEDDDINLLALSDAFKKEYGKKPRVENYLETVVYKYDDEEFRNNFRLSWSTFDGLENILSPIIMEKTGKPGHPFTNPRKQILLTLAILGTPESYRSVCKLYDVGTNTGLRCVRRVVEALVQLASRFIKWPELNEQRNIAASFKRGYGFPGVIGCIDGSHIPIPAPHEDAASYINRKSFHSINLQGVCGIDMAFIHVYVGQVGSVHDARVLKRSEVDGYLRGNRRERFVDDEHHLLGDAAYPALIHLMPPFKDNGHLTERQKNYNTRLSSTRMVIERTFGHLKGRWRRLKYLHMSRIDLIPNTVLACCVLHNICCYQKDPHFDIEIMDDPIALNNLEVREAAELAGNAKRTRIMNSLR